MARKNAAGQGRFLGRDGHALAIGRIVATDCVSDRKQIVRKVLHALEMAPDTRGKAKAGHLVLRTEFFDGVVDRPRREVLQEVQYLAPLGRWMVIAITKRRHEPA